MRKLNTVMFSLAVTGAVLIAPFARADVPVVDLTQQASSSKSTQAITSGIDTAQPSIATSNNYLSSNAALPLEQRIGVMERQITNLNQMDLMEQINRLQQELATLRGQFDIQANDLKQLRIQVKAQYQDIDTRLTNGGAKKSLMSDSSVDAKNPEAEKTVAKLPITAASSSSADSTPDANITTDIQEQQAYQAAIDLSKKGDYVRATTAFQNYIAKYANGKYTANAHYWLGEIYLIQGQPDPAAGEFKTVLTNYPTHPKVPDAVLKLGQAYYDKGDYKQAKIQFTIVKTQFPNSVAAKSAITRLQKMVQDGKAK